MLLGERDKLRQELEEAMLPFRLVQKPKGIAAGCGGAGWLKSIRQAVGIPVDEVARRLGVCRWEIHRLEESELNSRIILATLSRAAKGLGCELVYALIPMEGTLEDLAVNERGTRKELRQERRRKREATKKPWLEEIGWREALLGALRTQLRREGFRVRPRKTDRGLAKQMAEFKETVKLAALAGKMGPLMIEAERQQASESASVEGLGNRE